MQQQSTDNDESEDSDDELAPALAEQMMEEDDDEPEPRQPQRRFPSDIASRLTEPTNNRRGSHYLCKSLEFNIIKALEAQSRRFWQRNELLNGDE